MFLKCRTIVSEGCSMWSKSRTIASKRLSLAPLGLPRLRPSPESWKSQVWPAARNRYIFFMFSFVNSPIPALAAVRALWASLGLVSWGSRRASRVAGVGKSESRPSLYGVICTVTLLKCRTVVSEGCPMCPKSRTVASKRLLLAPLGLPRLRPRPGPWKS